MKTSEATNEVFGALALVQGGIIDAYKDKEGYGYKYADLSSVLQIVRPVLAKHGLCLIQDAAVIDGAVSVLTRLGHQSGQWLECGPLSMAIEPKKSYSAAQCTGTVVTYARRYALTAALGITQDDDDASTTKESTPKETAPQQDGRIADLAIEIADAVKNGDDFAVRVSLGALSPQDKGPVWSMLAPGTQQKITTIMKGTTT